MIQKIANRYFIALIEDLSGLVFKGSLEKVNHFFYQKGWTNGMPVMPPTKEAVEEMLKGTDLPGDHGGPVTKKVNLPRDWKALVEKYQHIVPTYVKY